MWKTLGMIPLAVIGLLVVFNAGVFISMSIFRSPTQPLRPDPRRWETMGFWPELGGSYKYHWWGLHNPDGSVDFYTHGKYDQIIYVAPRKNVVIVRLGEGPDGDLYWPLVLQNIVDQIPRRK